MIHPLIMYSIANWNPPIECCRLLTEGRKLAYCKKFGEAIQLFKKCIDVHSHGSEDASATTTFRAPWSRNTLITAARLFIMKVCWSNKDATGACQQAEMLQPLVAQILDIKMMVHGCWVIAQVCRSIAERCSDKKRQIVLTGVSACRSVLPHRTHLRHLHERARFLDLESLLHALNCTCPDLESQCGSLAMATRRLEECIECHRKADKGSESAKLSKAKRNSKKNFQKKPKKKCQWQQPNQPSALMRRRLERLKALTRRLPTGVKRAREAESAKADDEKEKIAQLNREKSRKRGKKKRVRLANCLNDKLKELAPSVRARLCFVEAMCKRRDPMDWAAVPPPLRPSSSGAGRTKPPSRAFATRARP